MLVAMGQPARYFWSKQIFVWSLSRWSIVAPCQRHPLFSHLTVTDPTESAFTEVP